MVIEHGRTVWVFGDQLSRDVGPLSRALPGSDRILMVESVAKIDGRRWHRQRLHLIVTAMRRLSTELKEAGFEVDYRRAPSFEAGLADHRAEFGPEQVLAMAPSTHGGRQAIRSLGVELVPDERFLTSVEDFDKLVAGRPRITMETFYRWQRKRLGYLMDGDEPAGGRWNFDHENRRSVPRSGVDFPDPVTFALDDLDAAVLDELPDGLPGEVPIGLWPTSRREALTQLRHAIDVVLPGFGPFEDAMTTKSWHLAHTLLSPALNLGLLHPREVADEVERAYRAGLVEIASAEGLLRQVIGWREFVWCIYWTQGAAYAERNELGAHRPLPPLFDSGATHMACVSSVLSDVEAYGWTHHIPRLMILGNLALLSGVEPRDLTAWMWERFVDGAEWVMIPNVVGMALYADGGVMATKPYAAGGAYIDKMSDFCGGCRYDRTKRTGPDACPYTTLYWDFLDRHQVRLAANHRMARQAGAARALVDMPQVRERSVEVLAALDAGTL